MSRSEVDQNDENDPRALLTQNPDEALPEMCHGCINDCETCSQVE